MDFCAAVRGARFFLLAATVFGRKGEAAAIIAISVLDGTNEGEERFQVRRVRFSL